MLLKLERVRGVNLNIHERTVVIKTVTIYKIVFREIENYIGFKLIKRGTYVVEKIHRFKDDHYGTSSGLKFSFV